MATAYALSYTSPANSFNKSYGVFYQDPEKPGLIFLVNMPGRAVFNTPEQLGKSIAKYQLKGTKNIHYPISFQKSPDFPDIGQLDMGIDTRFPLAFKELKVPTVFKELKRAELRKAQNIMIKTLKGE